MPRPQLRQHRSAEPTVRQGKEPTLPIDATLAVLAFSRTQRPWLQDALRRLALRADLDEASRGEVIRNLRSEHESIDANQAAAACESLSESHFRPAASAAEPLTLIGLRDAKHTNRLAANQSLRFAVDGITLAYGNNGSGKSGYCRLLKKLCRVREGAEEQILPNVFQQSPPVPAEVTVRFAVGETPQDPVTWRDGTPPPTVLRRISVFDSRAAQLRMAIAFKIDGSCRILGKHRSGGGSTNSSRNTGGSRRLHGS